MRELTTILKSNSIGIELPDFEGKRLTWPLMFWLSLLCAISFILHLTYAVWITPINKSILVSLKLLDDHYDTNYLAAGGDEVDYFQIALNLTSGRGYSRSMVGQPTEPTAYRPPLYPIVLSVIFRSFGVSLKYGLIMNQIFITLLIPISFSLGRLLYNNKCGVISAVLVALWPNGFYFSGFLLTEPMATLFQMITFWLLIRFVLSPSPILAASAGITAAASSLIRSNFFFVLIFIGLWFLLLPDKSRKWHFVLLFFAMCSMGISPWILRNYLVMKAFIPGTTGSGVVFAGAHSAETVSNSPGGWIEPVETNEVIKMSEAQQDIYYWRVGFVSMKQQSFWNLIKTLVLKVFRLWIPVQRIIGDNICSTCNHAASFIFLMPFLLSIYGLRLYRSNQPLLYLVIAILGGTTMMTLVFWGSTRFRMPVEPILWIFAASAIVHLEKNIKNLIKSKNEINISR